MANGILLTIAIPTYNGAQTIARSLSTILPQLTPEVEVVVSDNGSTDGTARLVREIASTAAQVRFFSNPSNVGFDLNVDLCFQRAVGDFVWIISDDDIICREGGVARVLEVIRAYPGLGAIFADSRHSIALDPADSGLCRDAADYFRKSRFKCGLISSNIFSRSAWQAVPLHQYLGSGWVHMGFLVEALPTFPSYVICEEMVAQLELEHGPTVMRWGGTGSFVRTGLSLVRIYRNMAALGYDRATVRAAYRTIKDGYPKNLLFGKVMGLRVDAPLLLDFVELYWKFPSFWLVDLPLLLLPGRLLRLARTMYRKACNKDPDHGY